MIKKIQSEEGSVVLLTLMVLMLITMFGFSALNTADTELLVSHNSRCYKQNLYQAEGVVRETGLLISNTDTDDLKPTSATAPTWLNNNYLVTQTFFPEDLADNKWDTSGGITTNATESALYGTDGLFTVFYLGPSAGDTLNIGETKLYEYSIYGKSSLCAGEVGVVAGYRQRF